MSGYEDYVGKRNGKKSKERNWMDWGRCEWNGEVRWIDEN